VKKDWVLGQEDFDQLLNWLDADRNQAGEKYELIRRNLIKMFVCRSCQVAEELADETMNRVAVRVRQIRDGYEGNPASYFYGVAKKVYLEHVRKPPIPGHLPTPSPQEQEKTEQEQECLERCMEGLHADSRDLVLKYYYGDKRTRIEHRKKLAEQLGVAGAALRLRAHRVRAALQDCVFKCLQQLETGQAPL
jgi:RNA polymerase sigma factor (sigma-70 family)